MEDLAVFSAKPRLRLLLDHFAKIKDTRDRLSTARGLVPGGVRDDRELRRLG
jgi:hypothetical protein